MELFEVVRGRLEMPVVLSCDHAGRLIPSRYGTLGVPPGQLEAWHGGADLGAGELFDALVSGLDCYGIKNRLSRLVIDMNRYVDQEEIIPTHCERSSIPGNQDMSAQECQRRIQEYYRPYHAALEKLLVDCEARHGIAFYLSIHAMAAEFGGQRRPMDFAIVCNAGCPLSPTLGRILRQEGFVVAVNEPYTLERDIVRVPLGHELERFNRRALLLEMNERHAGDEKVMGAVLEAIRHLLQRHAETAWGDEPGTPDARPEPEAC